MANKNQIKGLARGTIGRDANSIRQMISDAAISMGALVKLKTTINTSEIFPRVLETTVLADASYGIAVAGVADGIYAEDGVKNSATLGKQATSAAGEAVSVLTQGECPAFVFADGGVITVGDKLTASTVAGVLTKAAGTTGPIIAMALQNIASGDTDIIAVNVQREGIFGQ